MNALIESMDADCKIGWTLGECKGIGEEEGGKEGLRSKWTHALSPRLFFLATKHEVKYLGIGE